MKLMNLSRILSSFVIAIALVAEVQAESSSAISNRTSVNTLDLLPLTTIPTSTRETTTADGRSLVRRDSPRLPVDRTGKKQLYYKMVVPEFSKAGAGWPGSKKGLGTFYGMEALYSGPAADSLHYKVGGAPPSTSTPESEWKSMVPNSVLNRSITPGIWYFRVALGSSTKESASLMIRYHCARLCGPDGGPIASLDASKNHWLLVHGKNSGESALRGLHASIRDGTSAARVVTLDWASGADAAPGWSKPAPNSQYFQPLGRSLADLLDDIGLKSSRLSLVGHSWGAVVCYETGRKFGNVGSLVALDPSAKAPGSYDSGSLNFSAVSRVSTGIKGGNKIEGSLGDEVLTGTCDFTVRLFADSHSGDPADSAFYHGLPIDWCAKAMSDDANAYAVFFKDSILTRTTAVAPMPWGEFQPLVGGFDFECHGRTSYTKTPGSTPDRVSFESTRFLIYSKPGGKLMKARASGEVASPNWSYTPY